jgi:superfamily II DNA or RNA helicase
VTALSDLIQTAQPLRTGATAVYPYSKALEKKFQFESRFNETVPLCRVDAGQGLIYLPRAVCPVGPNDERDPGEVVMFPKVPVPRPNQITIFQQTIDFLSKGFSGVVVAYTGWGKTVLGYAAASAMGRKTLVITTKEDIYKQWIEGAETILGLDKSKIGEIRGDKCEVTGTHFVVAMIQSLSKDEKYPDWITKGFGLVIFDECHRVPAEQFSRVVDMFPAKLRLGLSASPNRADGKELVVYSHIGPVRAQTLAELMIPKVLTTRSTWKCPRHLVRNVVTGETDVERIPHQAGKTTHIEKIIAADSERNHLIAHLAKEALDKGRRIVLFSTLHEHLKSIHRACREKEGISGKDMGYYLGAVTTAEKEARDKSKVKPLIFTTYSMMSEGTSIDWLDTCILAMPRATVTQPVGRIRREYEKKKPIVVIDIVDNDSPVFSRYAAKRLQWYKSIGCEIKALN